MEQPAMLPTTDYIVISKSKSVATTFCIFQSHNHSVNDKCNRVKGRRWK